MSTQSETLRDPQPESHADAPIAVSSMQPLVWSVRRELWEHYGSICIAPLVVAGLIVLAFLISVFHQPGHWMALATHDAERQSNELTQMYGFVAMPILFTSVIVAVFYCLDSLYAERRERSILFWKSLPVSDLTTVLSKVAIPLLVIPLVTFGVIVCVQLILLVLATAVLPAKGIAAATLWTQVPVVRMPLVALYGLLTLALWHAPIYGWLFLVSAWARRHTFPWATLPILALAAVERIAFGTSYVVTLLKYRVAGGFQEAFSGTVNDAKFHGLPVLDPGKFFTSPGLWIGLLVAAALFAAVVRLRRVGEPT